MRPPSYIPNASPMQVGNTIGKGNRFLFLTFLVVETVAMSSGMAVAILRVHQSVTGDDYLPSIPWIALFILGDGFLLIGVTALMITQVFPCFCRKQI